MSLSKRMLLMVAAAAIGSAVASAAPISFVPPLPATCPMQFWGCETTGTPTFGAGNAWQVTSGNIDFVVVGAGGWWTGLSSPGGYVIDLSGSTLGSISTTLNGLTPGGAYVLTFQYTYNPDNSTTLPRQANVSATGGYSWTTAALMNTTNGVVGTGNNINDSYWQTGTLSFVASAAGTSTISFNSLNNTFQGIVLRNTMDVSASAASTVPEPATFAIMGAGLVLLGLKRFRRA